MVNPLHTKVLLVALLWPYLVLCSATNTSSCSTQLGRHGVRRELWNKISGGYFLKYFMEDRRFIQNKPDSTTFLENFNPPHNFSDSYGQRLSAFFIPRISGKYTFVATCDSECKVSLSKDENSENKQTIISLEQIHKTGYHEWNRFAQQRSCPQELKSHVVYYMEALHSNYKLRDHLHVRVFHPGKQALQAIESSYLVPYDRSSLQCSLLKTQCGILCGGSNETHIRPVDPVTHLCNFSKYFPNKVPPLPEYFLNVSTKVTSSTTINVLWHFVDNIKPKEITSYQLIYSYNSSIPQVGSSNSTQRTYSIFINKNTSAASLTGLEKFTIYCIRIVYIARDVREDSGCTYAQTHEDVPSRSPTHQVMNYAVTSIRVTWQPLEERYIHGVLRGYRIKIINMNKTDSQPEVIQTGSDANSVNISGVKRLTYYCVQILAFTRKGSGPSSQCVYIFTLTEGHLLQVSTTTTSSTSIQVSWNFANNYVPKGITGYRLSYNYNRTLSDNEGHNDSFVTFSTVISRNLSAVSLTGLRKYTLYCIQMAFLVYGNDGGSSRCAYAWTHEDVPNKSPSLRVTNNALTSIRVTWQPLHERYIPGILRGYRIKIINMNETGSQPKVIQTGSDANSVIVNGVTKLNYYCAKILAFTSKGEGPYSKCVYIITWTEDILPQTAIHNYTGTTTLNITWAPLPSYLRTHLLGYRLSYTAIKHAEIDLKNQPTHVINVTANVTRTCVTGLRIYTIYRLEVRPLIRIGIGQTRAVLFAATCNCNPSMIALWSPVPPYAVHSSTSTPTGLIPQLLSEMVGFSCGHCSEYVHGKSRIVYHLDDYGSSRGIRDIDFDRDKVDFIFPVRQSRDRQTPVNGDYYIPLLEVPGFAFLTSVKKELAYARQVASSVYQCWPIVAISLAMTIVSGFVLWLAEAITNRKELPAHFYQGVTETIWWSFITMTTVGYGDRVPRSNIGRVFSIVWFFIGMIMVALLVGSITTSLSVKILNEQFFVKRDKRLASLDNPLDYRALMRVDERASTRSTYQDLESLAEALKVGQAEGIIVDMYMAGFRTDLFNGSWYKVSTILDDRFYYGVNIGGSAARLVKKFQEYSTSIYEVKIKLLQQEREKERVSNQFYTLSQTVRQDLDLLDPSTVMYQLTVILLLAALGSAVVIGMLYHSWNKNSDSDSDKYAKVLIQQPGPSERYNKTREELRYLLETFYQQIKKTHFKLKEKHRREWIEYVKQRRAKLHEVVWL